MRSGNKVVIHLRNLLLTLQDPRSTNLQDLLTISQRRNPKNRQFSRRPSKNHRFFTELPLTDLFLGKIKMVNGVQCSPLEMRQFPPLPNFVNRFYEKEEDGNAKSARDTRHVDPRYTRPH
jgi:hypothetical protein